jgi:hypothetical protein
MNVLVAGLVVVLTSPSIAFAQSTPYDDFSAPKLDPAKWSADQSLNNDDGAGLEISRMVAGGALKLYHRVVGSRSDDTSTENSSDRLIFRTPYTSVKFDVKVLSASISGCSASGAPDSSIEARSWSTLFNDGTEDVTGTVNVYRTPESKGLRASGFVSGGGKFFGTVDLGAIANGSVNTLRMHWNQTAHQVEFTVNGGATKSVVYTLSDSAPPLSPFSVIEVAGFISNCTAGSLPNGQMTATFDNVLIDAR